MMNSEKINISSHANETLLMLYGFHLLKFKNSKHNSVMTMVRIMVVIKMGIDLEGKGGRFLKCWKYPAC